MIRHLLLTLLSDPRPTPDWAITAAEGLAVHLDAELCAVVGVVTIPDVSGGIALRMLGTDPATVAANLSSMAAAEALSARFAAVTGSADPHRQARIESYNIIDPNPIARHARLFDLALLPSYGHPDTRWLIEGLLFESGRPVMLYPERPANAWQRIVIGWDASRAAARALADALPLCRRAAAIEIVTVRGEKPLPRDLAHATVLHHLACHGVTATSRTIPLAGDDAGATLLAHAQRENADLLVMGGFGHSRMREFFLGGATQTVIQAPTLPVLLSN